MPQGTVYKPDGPQDKEKLGQILCLDGDIIPFFNVKNLQKGEPIIFDIIRTKLEVKLKINGDNYNYNGKIPVGILPKDFEINYDKPAKAWPESLKKRWKEEWQEFENDDEIETKLNVKLKHSVINHPNFIAE